MLDAEPGVGDRHGAVAHGRRTTVDSTGDFYTVGAWRSPAIATSRPIPCARPARCSGERGASLFRSSLFADVGLFDEEFFAYFEDVDLSRSAPASPATACATARDAVAYHDQGATSRTVSGFATRQFFRNLPLLLAKNVPARLLPAVVPRFLLVYSLMAAYQFRRGRTAGAPRCAQSFALVARCLPRRRAIQRARRVDAPVVRGCSPGCRRGCVLRGTRRLRGPGR